MRRSLPVRVRLSVALAAALVAGTACGGGGGATRQVLVPPRLDLRPYGRVGLVLFTVEKAKGSLDQLATERFSEDILAAQPGVEVMELGSVDSTRQRVGETDYGAATAQALADRGVPVVFFGHLKVSNVTPSGGIGGLSIPHLEAKVSVELTAALLSTKTGGTLWRGSGGYTGKVGGLAIVGGEPVFSAHDPKATYGRLVNEVVDYVTSDMRSTWQEAP